MKMGSKSSECETHPLGSRNGFQMRRMASTAMRTCRMCNRNMCSAVGNTESGTYLVPPKFKRRGVQIDGRMSPMVRSKGRLVMTVGAGNHSGWWCEWLVQCGWLARSCPTNGLGLCENHSISSVLCQTVQLIDYYIMNSG